MLTLPQAACLTTIIDFQRRGLSPSVTEIAAALKIARKAAVSLISGLQSRGYVRRERKRREITIIRMPIVSVYRFDDDLKQLVPRK